MSIPKKLIVIFAVTLIAAGILAMVGTMLALGLDFSKLRLDPFPW